MLSSIHQILPSLAALGILGYWIIGAAAALEAFLLTGIFVPGTLIVDAGGVMVQQGLLDFFDLAWFVAIGSILGGEASFWLGHRARRGMLGRWNVEAMPAFARAQRLFTKRGGFALVLGRFLGPVAAFVPFAAAIAGMETRRFRIWNIVSGFPYALAHLAIGYGLGSGLSRFSPVMTRAALFVAVLAVLAALLWWTLRQLDRALPYLLAMAGGVMDDIARHPRIDSWGARHPRVAKFLTRRLDRPHFLGLPATVLGVAFAYLAVLWLGLAFDFVRAEPIVQIDARLAQLMHLFWTPALIQVFTWFTALGDTRLVAAVLALAVLWLALLRRPGLLVGLLVALGTDLISVIILKTAFGRPRSALGYFAETTGSFPSGHATLSVAFYGMLFYLLWRLGRMGAVMAAFLATLVAGLIGLSRLYLVEHYLSDVLAGWMLGGLCLISGIAVAEWMMRGRAAPQGQPPNWQKITALLVSLVLVGYAGLRVNDYSKALNPSPALGGNVQISSTSGLFGDHALPATAETLSGERKFAINIAFWAKDSAQLRSALQTQGWTPSAAPSLGGLVKTAIGDLRDRARAGDALAPLFWNTLPNDLAFSLNGNTTERDQPRLRLWSTRFTRPDGTRLWLGTLTRDNGVDLEEGTAAPELASALAKGLIAKGLASNAGTLTPTGQSAIALMNLR
ncbi:phosphatase PAP2 family protein [Thioclava sp.]|uniref:bifunctional DedA family/phosphatase PAP2 family protein n=1 Tax=Thioclava sp. TaxID=1933450 RepID=UPI003AA96561